ncbi:ABC transporter permease [Cellulomonas rhizosphaerae]|nr:ABC transporter permease [Cellulomonas rhizosphaerae]
MVSNRALLLHRARSQQSLLLVVLAVTVVGATLLGTFALLLAASENRMLAVAMEQSAPGSREIDVTVSSGSAADVAGALPPADAFLDDLLGGLPSDRDAWLASSLYTIEGTADARAPYTYFAANAQYAQSSTLVSGAFPTSGVDAAGRVPVAVPQVAADAYGWTVGSVVRLQQTSTLDPVRAVVTGTYRLTGAPQTWSRDVLDGSEHDEAYPVLGAGFLTTRAWGPLVVGDPTVLTDGTVALGVAHLVARPTLADAPTGAIDDLRGRLDASQATLAAAIPTGVSALVASPLGSTIDAAAGDLQVTRVTLVVVALLLATLAVTVLMLAARMLSDRRLAEQELMASRGASRRQVVRLALLEATGLAVITAVASPFLAELTYRAIVRIPVLERGGLDVDPGRPLLLWAACGVSALVLVGVLVIPLLRRGERRSGRSERGGSAARSGADIALVLVAGIALWQLSSYQGAPSGAGAGLSSVDPVLVLAPALVLLAGAVLALRCMPVVAHLGERAASRSRAWVSPLAVWELARRPARASSAVLLVALTVGVAAFSTSFLQTWRSSQQDQADLAVGTDLRATPALGTPLEAGAQLAAVPGTGHAAPVTIRDSTVGVATGPGNSSGGVPATLLAVDTTRADELLRGRVAPGWGDLTAGMGPSAPATGVALPGSPRFLVLDLQTHSSAPETAATVVSWLVVQDRAGARTSLALPSLLLGRARTDVVLPLGAESDGLQLVGLVARAVPASGSALPTPAPVTLDLTHLRVTSAASADLDGADVEAVSFAGAAWESHASGAEVSARADRLRVSGDLPTVTSFETTTELTATTFPDPSSGAAQIAVLVTPDVLDTLGAGVGDPIQLDVAGASVPAVVRGTVPYLPGAPHGRGVLVDEDLLGRAVLVAGSPGALADEWWLAASDDAAPGLASDLERSAGMSTVVRATERAEATDGPLHVGVQAALWMLVTAALALSVSGLGMSAAVTVRNRRLEFARLQALGAPRGGLVRSVLSEHAVLGLVGVAAGMALGALLAQVVAPLITTSASGAAPVPGVVVQWDWSAQLALLGILVGLVTLVVALTTGTLLKRASGQLLRLGDEQ